MKKKHQEKYELGIYSGFAILWHKCCKCHNDFRFEAFWRFLAGPFYGRIGKWYYLCRECAPTKNEAHELARANCYMPPRPKWPPPPPPPVPKKKCFACST